MTEPTPEQVRSLWRHMLARYGAVRVSKSSAPEMRLAARVLSMIGILDTDDFLANYATTIGRRVYLPFVPGLGDRPWSLWAQVIVCAHELQHVVQFGKGGVFGYYVPYLTSKAKRTMFETEAYRSFLELEFWRTGKVPSAGALAESLKSYGLSHIDLLVAETALRMSAHSIARGAIVNDASRTAIDWLNDHAPEIRARH